MGDRGIGSGRTGGVLLAVCWLLHLGLVALPVAPRGAVCSVASSRGVVASMLSAGAASRMPDPPPSSCGLLQRGWGFLLRSAAGWGFARRLELSPTRMEPSPRSVPLSAAGPRGLLRFSFRVFTGGFSGLACFFESVLVPSESGSIVRCRGRKSAGVVF